MLSESQESTRGFVAHDSGPKQPASVSSMHVSKPALQPGIHTLLEGVLEHGSHESDIEDFGQPGHTPTSLSEPEPAPGQPEPSASLSRGFGKDPTLDVFLRGNFPPGVISHYSSTFGTGREHWEDSYYEKDQAHIGPDKPIKAPIDSDKPIKIFLKDTGSSQQQSGQIEEISSQILNQGSGYETVEPGHFDIGYTTEVGEYGAGSWGKPGYSDTGHTTDMWDYDTGSQANLGYFDIGYTTWTWKTMKPERTSPVTRALIITA